MTRQSADKTRQPKGAADPLERLQSAGLGAFFRPSQLEQAGLTRDRLPALLRSGRIERVGRGLYRFADAEPSADYSVAMACARVPTSVVCLLTALRIHEIGTQAPAAVWLAIPHKARVPRLRELKLKVVRFSGSAWTLGVQETEFEGVAAASSRPPRERWSTASASSASMVRKWQWRRYRTAYGTQVHDRRAVPDRSGPPVSPPERGSRSAVDLSRGPARAG